MNIQTEVFVRASTEDQARIRALNGWYQATPEDATRGMLETEHVFLVRVEVVAVLDDYVPTLPMERPRKSKRQARRKILKASTE